jgi:lipid-binding SYLF domain-containing protein
MSKLCAVISVTLAIAGCTSKGPSSPTEAANLEHKASAALADMRADAPGLDSLLAASAGYAVFPNVGSAGALLAGGAYGKGVLYEHGVSRGYVSLSQGSIGPQLGGQTFAELLVLRTDYDVQRLKAGKFDFGANATAVVLTAGATLAGDIDRGSTVFVMPHGGMMAGLSVSGQHIDFVPRG